MRTLLVLLACAADAGAQSLHLETFGPQAGGAYGQGVAVAGDLDGDGAPEALVGAPQFDGAAPNSGRVLAQSPADGHVLWTRDGAAGQLLGFHVAGLGDVDADGVPDVLAATEGLSQPGHVLVLSGVDGHTLREFVAPGADEAFGDAICSVNDFDGDGAPDVLVGAWAHDGGFASGRGAAFLYSGASGAPLGTWTGAHAGDHLGEGVAGLDDWDGDGRADLALGVPGADLGPQADQLDLGQIQVISSITHQPLTSVWGWEPGAFFGEVVADAGDLDGDGRRDLVGTSPAGAWGRAFRAPDAAPLFTFASDDFPAQKPGLLFGRETTGAGDMDGDGHGDLVVGDSTWALPGTPLADSGRVYAFSGATGAPLFHIDGELDHEFLGRAVGGGLDLQGDGLSDALIGCWGWDGPLGSEQGRVLVLCGSHGSLLPYGSGAISHTGLGLPTGGGFVPVVVHVDGAPPSAPGLIVVGRNPADQMFAGIHLLLTPILAIVPIVSDASGSVQFKVKLPGILPAPELVFRTQVLFAGPPHVASNGLVWTVDALP